MDRSDYQRVFDRIEPPAELVERTGQMVSAPRRPRRPVRRIIAAAAAVCLLAALGGSFAIVETVDPLTVKLETWNVAELATPVGASDSSLGWTVTVDSVLGDSWYAYILCTLSRDDGTALTPGSFGFHDWDFGIPDGKNNSSSIHWLADGDLTDNKAPFGFYLSNQNSWDMNGTTLHLTLEGLSTASLGESWALMAGGGGKWELEFTLPAESTAEDFAPALAFRLGEVEAVLETVRVSPLEVWVECFSAEGAFCMLNPAREDYDPEWANANRPCLVLADGTELYADGSGGGSGDGSYWYSGFRAAEKPVAPEDITGLRVGETVYPLCLR